MQQKPRNVSSKKPRNARGLSRICKRSDVARHLTSLKAGGAYVQALRRALYEGAYTLNVWIPAAVRAHMRVRDALAEAWTLAADFTYRGHDSLLYVFHKAKWIGNFSMIANNPLRFQPKRYVALSTFVSSSMAELRAVVCGVQQV